MDPTMPGLYGLGGGNRTDPNDLSQMLRMHSLMTMMQPQQGKSSGPSQLGGALMAAMLMNPKAMKGIGQGLGNWFDGNNWNGTPGPSAMNALSQQAQNQMAGGGILY